MNTPAKNLEGRKCDCACNESHTCMYNTKSKVLYRGRTKAIQETSAQRPCRAGVLWIVSVFPVLGQYSLDMCKLGCVETASVQFAYLHPSFVQFPSVKKSCIRYSSDLCNLYAVIFGSVQVWCQLLDSLDLCKVLPVVFGSVHLFQCSVDLVSFVLEWFASLQLLLCYSYISCNFCNIKPLDLSNFQLW